MKFRMSILFLLIFTMLFVGCAKEEKGPTAEANKETVETQEDVVEAPAKSENDFPTKTINAICPWSAGGGTDTILRGLAKETEKIIGQTITVTNQTGGGGAIGHAAIMTAPNDGYTVGMITFELSSLPAQGLVPFTYADFEPLMRVNMDAAALTVSKDAPYNTVEEFIAYAKEHPGEINIGNSGAGAVWHIAAGLMAENANINVTHVPFEGAAPAVTALVGGHIQAVSVSAAEVQGQVEAGDLKILGVMSEKRLDAFPDVVTFKEVGIDVVFGTWRGLAVPKGTPEEAKVVLAESFLAGMESDEFQEYAMNSGLVLAYQDADEFADFLEVNAKDVAIVMQEMGLTNN